MVRQRTYLQQQKVVDTIHPPSLIRLFVKQRELSQAKIKLFFAWQHQYFNVMVNQGKNQTFPSPMMFRDHFKNLGTKGVFLPQFYLI